MSVFVVNTESVEGTEVIGVFLNEKLAKIGAKDYVDTWYSENDMKKKQTNKESIRKVLYIENIDKNPIIISMSEIEFDVPTAKKQKKDPNAPKRGLTSYMIFSKENRKRIQEENPEALFGEIGRLVGAEWKALSEDQQLGYQKKSEIDKKRYETDKAKYET